MFNNAAVFLRSTGHKARDIDQGDNGNIEGIAKTHKARGFNRCLDVQATRQNEGLIGYNANGLSFYTTKTNQDILGVIGLQLKKLTVVCNLANQLMHIVRLIGIGWH